MSKAAATTPWAPTLAKALQLVLLLVLLADKN